MKRRHPRSTRPATLFPDTTRIRSHVDFAYEVSRSLAACEGSILVVDASQGVEAQTLANVYQAIEANHEIIPVLNKIDLPRSEEHTSELQSLMRISYAVFCLKKKNNRRILHTSKT